MSETDSVRVIKLEDEEVVLDPSKYLRFNPATLSEYLQNVSINYDHFSSKSAKVDACLANAQLAHETKYWEKFLEGKANGFTEKASEGYAKTNADVRNLMEMVNHYKDAQKQMKEWIRALDKAHDCAKSRSYMLVKEMDNLGVSFKSSEQSLEDIIGK